MIEAPGEKVAVVWASWEGARIEAETARVCMIAHMAMHLPPGALFFSMQPRTPTAVACTKLVQWSLEKGADWILYLDDDVCPQPDVYFQLRQHADPVERPIVSALGFYKEPPHFPSIFKYDGWEGTDVPSIGTPTSVLDYPENQLIKVDGCGMTCMLMHKSVFERIDKPWFGPETELRADGMLNQNLWKAKIPTYLHTGIIVDHLFTGRANDKTWKKWLADNGMEKAKELNIQHFRLNEIEMPSGDFEIEEPLPHDPGPMELQSIGRTLSL